MTVKLARDLETGVHHRTPFDWVTRVNRNGLQLNLPAKEEVPCLGKSACGIADLRLACRAG